MQNTDRYIDGQMYIVHCRQLDELITKQIDTQIDGAIDRYIDRQRYILKQMYVIQIDINTNRYIDKYLLQDMKCVLNAAIYSIKILRPADFQEHGCQ